MRVTLRADLADVVTAGTEVSVRYSLENDGNGWLIAGGMSSSSS